MRARCDQCKPGMAAHTYTLSARESGTSSRVVWAAEENLVSKIIAEGIIMIMMIIC